MQCRPLAEQQLHAFLKLSSVCCLKDACSYLSSTSKVHLESNSEAQRTAKKGLTDASPMGLHLSSKTVLEVDVVDVHVYEYLHASAQ
jgi:hypothetical protein